uniref:Uncharacterized protein n=1 Tax=Heterorhabditis bacteriophora TaxID=37862 RepID=A0A1I7X200_HETBA
MFVTNWLPLIFVIIVPTWSLRLKREDHIPWQVLVQMHRIFQAGNSRALDIEAFTKQAAIRQNQHNALLSSSGSVLSPMAAVAVAANRFNPPDIVSQEMARSDADREFLAKIQAQTRLMNNMELLTNRHALFGNDLHGGAIQMRDALLSSLIPPPIHPLLAQRMIQTRMHSKVIDL